MTEQERDILLSNIANAVAELVQKTRNAKAIGDMTEEQFTDLLLKVTDHKQYLAAKREEEISRRIFADVDGLIQTFHPFRVTGAKGASDLYKMMREYLESPSGSSKQFVVALAVVKEDGGYEAVPR